MEYKYPNDDSVAFHALMHRSGEMRTLSSDLLMCKALATQHFNDASVDAAVMIYDRLQTLRANKNKNIH